MSFRNIAAQGETPKLAEDNLMLRIPPTAIIVEWKSAENQNGVFVASARIEFVTRGTKTKLAFGRPVSELLERSKS